MVAKSALDIRGILNGLIDSWYHGWRLAKDKQIEPRGDVKYQEFICEGDTSDLNHERRDGRTKRHSRRVTKRDLRSVTHVMLSLTILGFP